MQTDKRITIKVICHGGDQETCFPEIPASQRAHFKSCAQKTPHTPFTLEMLE